MRKINKNNNNYSFKFIRNGVEEVRCRTHKLGRFRNFVQRCDWKEHNYKAYLRVSYGKGKDVFGETVVFYNDGWYTSLKDFDRAYQAFMEIGR